jgi:adhesin transport system outer membrane protein
MSGLSKYIAPLAAAVFVFSSPFAAAAITLEETLREIAVTHPRILEKQKDYNAAVKEIKQAETSFNPTVDFEAEAGREDISNSSTRFQKKDSWIKSTRVSAKQLIFDNGRAKKNISAARCLAMSAYHGFKEAENQILFEAIESYISVLKFLELMHIAEENVDIHKKLLDDVKARVETGLGGKAEQERVQGRLASAQSVLIARQNEYKRSIYNFHKYMGRFEEGEEMTAPSISVSELPADLQLALEIQSKNHPSLLASEYNIEVKEWEHKTELDRHSPSLYFEASRDKRINYSGVDGTEDDTRVMLKYKMSVYDGGVKHAKADRFKSLINREKEAMERIRRVLINDLQLTWTGFKLLDSQIGALKKSLIFTRQALKSYKEEFKLGQRLLINILDAENEYQNMRAQLASVQFEYLTSKYRVLYSIGALYESLKLETPEAKKVRTAKRPVTASIDVVPPPSDFDRDGVADKNDISMNSRAGSKVNLFGEDEEKSRKFLQDPAAKGEGQTGEVAIKTRADLESNAIKPDRTVRLDIVSFVRESVELVEESKKIMRPLVEQLKKLASDGIIQIRVLTSELKTDRENYMLALKRAYHIKKIFSVHNMDPEAIQVFAGPAEGRGGEGTSENAVIYKLVTKSEDLKESYEPMVKDGIYFSKDSEKLPAGAEPALKSLSESFKRISNPLVDVVVYSNDYDDIVKNEKISERRAEEVKKALTAAGVPQNVITPIAWGGYDALLDQPDDTSEAAVSSRVEFVLRSK